LPAEKPDFFFCKNKETQAKVKLKAPEFVLQKHGDQL
jgi:hypothetical protein